MKKEEGGREGGKRRGERRETQIKYEAKSKEQRQKVNKKVVINKWTETMEKNKCKLHSRKIFMGLKIHELIKIKVANI